MLGNQNAVTLEGNNKLVDQKVPFTDLDRSFTLRYSEVRNDEEVNELKHNKQKNEVHESKVASEAS